MERRGTLGSPSPWSATNLPLWRELPGMCSTALRWPSTIGIDDDFLCYGVLGIDTAARRQKFASRARLGEGGERTRF